MQHVSLTQGLPDAAAEALSPLLDLPIDHLQAAWTLLREGRGYRVFTIGGADHPRLTHVPLPTLAAVQQRLLRRVLLSGPISPAAYAGVPGRSHLMAVRVHADAPAQMLRLDLVDAYGSTTYHGVAAALRRRLKPELYLAGLDRAERNVVAGVAARLLLARRDRGQRAPRTRGWQLPLGAPSSVAVFNLVLRAADLAIVRELATLTADGPPVRYTRYVDDLAFSCRGPLPGRLWKVVTHHLRRAGYALQPTKTHFMDGPPFVLHGVELGPGGRLGLDEAGRRTQSARLGRLVAQLSDRGASDEVRRGAYQALRGLDLHLAQVYGEGPRPAGLTVDWTSLPTPAPPAPHTLDDLWP